METVEKNLISLSQVHVEDGKELYEKFLLQEESVFGSYKGIRDRLVITNRRIIVIDVQGLTGKKKEFMFIPYSKVVSYAVESAGTIDLNSELKLWLSGIGGVKFNFAPKTDIFGIGQFLGRYIV